MRVTEPYTIFPRTLSSGKTVYYYQFRDDKGHRSSAKSTGCTTISSAKRFCQKLYNEGAFKKDSSLSFSVYTQDFFSEHSRYYKWKVANKERISRETMLAYDKFLRNQLIPFFSDYKITAIKRSDVKEWVIWANDKWSPKTVNSAQTVLNLIFKQAIDEEIIENNPCYNLSFRTIQKKHRELLTIEEVRDLYNNGKWWYDNKLIFLLDIITGMRISEVVALQSEDIHDNYIDVKHSYSRQFGLGSTKTNECRFVPIPTELAKTLRLRRGFLFINHEGQNIGKPLNINSFYTNLTENYTYCGIDYKSRGLTVHTNRDFYNTYLESENVPEPKIRAVIGHKDSSMTNLYTYWKPDMFSEVYSAQEKLYRIITE
ncbi:Site-specific recombinase XerD [Treponema bryantii]|uniref:Site-specific recombinase XerD n=1 Tax=Treponema bryantii TaxID=163 RepID=A0A1H9AS16_9SPIR|nr:site-specific integrase [Treponema bryantii]SEP79321.1 Site-specific recombinase XerD [Treponema bryantii]